LAWFELVAAFEIITFRPLRYLAMNVLRAVLVFILTLGAARLTHDPILTAVGLSLGMLASTLIGRFPGKDASPSNFDRSFAAKVLVFGLPFTISMTLDSLLQGGPRIIIQILDSSAALGHYTAAYLLVTNTLTIIGAGISSAGLSLTLRASEDGDSLAVRHQLLSNGELLLAVTAPAALGMALTARSLTATLVGPQFSEIAVLIPWLAFGAFLGALRGNFLDFAFQLSHKTHFQIWVALVGAIVAIVLSIYLVPTIGALGAAIAVTVGVGLEFCLALVLGRRVFPLPLPVEPALRILAACVFMTLMVRAVPGTSPAYFILQVAIGMLSYAGAAFALNILKLRTATLARFAR
jgi:O-antigen/teichoic acid export membrane protein